VEEFARAIEQHISDNLCELLLAPRKIKIYFDRERLASKTAGQLEPVQKASATPSGKAWPEVRTRICPRDEIDKSGYPA